LVQLSENKSMKKLFLAFCVLLSASVASATDTQVVTRKNLGNVLQRRGFIGTDLTYVLKHMALAKIYATAAERDATTPDAGTVGYAADDASFKWYSSAGWQAVTLTAGGNATVTGVTYANGGVDRSTAAALAVGATNATYVNIGATATPVAITSAGAITVPSTTTATGAIYANGGVDRSTAAGLTIGAANATSVTITPATTVTGVLTGTNGLKTTKPLMLLGKIRFCGNGSNGTTPWFDGPVLPADYAADMSIGGAGCDANDSATEATADRPLDPYSAIKVVGMACTTQAGGAADVGTYQLRSATANVTGVTCTVTNDGAAPKTCSVILSAPVAITAGATLAVQNTQSGTDDMSAKDMGCEVFYTY
jgi:hypothetical protein